MTNNQKSPARSEVEEAKYINQNHRQDCQLRYITAEEVNAVDYGCTCAKPESPQAEGTGEHECEAKTRTFTFCKYCGNSMKSQLSSLALTDEQIITRTISDLRMYMAAAIVKNPLQMIDEFEQNYPELLKERNNG